MRYRDAGVDIAAANRAKTQIKELVSTTFNPRVLRGFGAFGGFFSLKGLPPGAVLVSSMDGVGTKLKIAFAANRHEGVARDLVFHSVNDIAVHGAQPLFFLDYLATGKIRAKVVTGIVRGLSDACRQVGCALIGGETAQMPGFYAENEYDLAGCIVGWVRQREILDGSRIRPGDVVLGLPSLGLHTNGYSLARKVLMEQAGIGLAQYVPELGRRLDEELLAPHRCYGPLLQPLHQKGWLTGLVHVTGGGITENTPRILPRHCQAEIQLGSWQVPPIFNMIARLGKVHPAEMLRTFNMGLGMLLIVPKKNVENVARALKRKKEKFWTVGKIARGKAEVKYLAGPPECLE
ncbi:MAG: phosphoribosylformylglycinamidine cyclo-ligase [Acidobacteria bacterium]|nr:MAG: phosphoribosylformylglycinamidine cyclo-ligase [Acidobacteriota bacterium]